MIDPAAICSPSLQPPSLQPPASSLQPPLFSEPERAADFTGTGQARANCIHGPLPGGDHAVLDGEAFELTGFAAREDGATQHENPDTLNPAHFWSWSPRVPTGATPGPPGLPTRSRESRHPESCSFLELVATCADRRRPRAPLVFRRESRRMGVSESDAETRAITSRPGRPARNIAVAGTRPTPGGIAPWSLVHVANCWAVNVRPSSIAGHAVSVAFSLWPGSAHPQRLFPSPRLDRPPRRTARRPVRDRDRVPRRTKSTTCTMCCAHCRG